MQVFVRCKPKHVATKKRKLRIAITVNSPSLINSDYKSLTKNYERKKTFYN